MPIVMSYKMLSYLQGEDDIGRVYNYRRPCVRPGLYGFLDLSYADNVIRDDLLLHMLFFFTDWATSSNRSFAPS